MESVWAIGPVGGAQSALAEKLSRAGLPATALDPQQARSRRWGPRDTVLVMDPGLLADLAPLPQRLLRYVHPGRSESFLELAPEIVAAFPDYTREYAAFSQAPLEETRSKVAAGFQLAAEEFNRKYGSAHEGASSYYGESQYYVFELLTSKRDQDLYARFHQAFLLPSLALSGPEVLDFGGGLGDYSLQAYLWGKSVTYLDLPSRVMSFARWFSEKYRMDISFEEATGRIDGRYDLIWSNAVLEHVEDPGETVRAMAQALKPGGMLFLLVDYSLSHDDEHPMHFSPGPLREAVMGALSTAPGLRVVPTPYGSLHVGVMSGGASPEASPLWPLLMGRARHVWGVDREDSSARARLRRLLHPRRLASFVRSRLRR